MPYFVYILYCSDGTFYTGLTAHLKRRLREHRSGKDHRAFTFSRRPVRLVWYEEVTDLETARRREKQVKSLKRGQKEALALEMETGLLEAFSRPENGSALGRS